MKEITSTSLRDICVLVFKIWEKALKMKTFSGGRKENDTLDGVGTEGKERKEQRFNYELRRRGGEEEDVTRNSNLIFILTESGRNSTESTTTTTLQQDDMNSSNELRWLELKRKSIREEAPDPVLSSSVSLTQPFPAAFLPVFFSWNDRLQQTVVILVVF